MNGIKNNTENVREYAEKIRTLYSELSSLGEPLNIDKGNSIGPGIEALEKVRDNTKELKTVVLQLMLKTVEFLESTGAEIDRSDETQASLLL